MNRRNLAFPIAVLALAVLLLLSRCTTSDARAAATPPGSAADTGSGEVPFHANRDAVQWPRQLIVKDSDIIA